MENKYQRGKIYKIVDVGYNKCYIGSTTEKLLSNRMSRHRYEYKIYKDTLQKKMASFDIFDEYGIDNCKIELIENFPCNGSEELRKREGHYIQNTDCVNRCVAGRNKEEWYWDNKEHCNKKSNENYYNNREHYLQKQKEYREKNTELVNVRQKEAFVCQCGMTYTYGHKARHLKTQKHQNYLKSLEQD